MFYVFSIQKLEAGDGKKAKKEYLLLLNVLLEYQTGECFFVNHTKLYWEISSCFLTSQMCYNYCTLQNQVLLCQEMQFTEID